MDQNDTHSDYPDDYGQRMWDLGIALGREGEVAVAVGYYVHGFTRGASVSRPCPQPCTLFRGPWDPGAGRSSIQSALFAYVHSS